MKLWPLRHWLMSQSKELQSESVPFVSLSGPLCGAEAATAKMRLKTWLDSEIYAARAGD